jgi:hypothetical protein
MLGRLQTDGQLFLLSGFAEALSYLLLGDYEKNQAIIEALLAQPAVHKSTPKTTHSPGFVTA